MRNFSRDPVKRFYQFCEKNPNNDCIEWNGEIIHNGYGRFSVNNKKTLAHRFSYELNNGKIPKNKLVCHKCDNRKCVNSKHLFVGTCKQNIKDMLNKKRQAYGERQRCAKLKVKDVIKIKKMINKGLSDKYINDKFNFVSRATINSIKNNRCWKHVNLGGE